MYIVPNVEEIKKRREDARLSMNELSMKAGLSPAAIFRLETKKTTKTSDLRLAQVAKALHCRVEEISISKERCQSKNEY